MVFPIHSKKSILCLDFCLLNENSLNCRSGLVLLGFVSWPDEVTLTPNLLFHAFAFMLFCQMIVISVYAKKKLKFCLLSFDFFVLYLRSQLSQLFSGNLSAVLVCYLNWKFNMICRRWRFMCSHCRVIELLTYCSNSGFSVLVKKNRR